MNIFKLSILLLLVVLSKSLLAEIIIGPVDKTHLKEVKEYKIGDGSSIFLYKYSPPLPPHMQTVLLMKNCDCERDLEFYVDDKGILFDVNDDSIKITPKGLLNTLYAGAGDVYKNMEVNTYTINFKILVEDIYQYRDPEIKKITADLFKFKWTRIDDNYQLSEKIKEVIIVDNLSENEDDSPSKKTVVPILDKDNSKHKAKPINSASGSVSLVFLSMLALRLVGGNGTKRTLKLLGGNENI